ncbi:batten's disease protein Cln3 [Melanogaster broomeanus]|nr:batten's disease protein Cln3 [Melanogaster broomeanus]
MPRIQSQEDLLEDTTRKTEGWKKKLRKLGLSFFLFGLINNVLYVIILSAALDLVPPSTPKGIIAFCNIFPALVAKLGWPYFLKGKIRYTRRILGCCLLSFIGMLVVALYESIYARLLGISLASFASGLGELTFLQLSTTYSPLSCGRTQRRVSALYFASGTGAAGLVGAFLWWEVRGLGVRLGVGISSILPFVLPITYFFPAPTSYTPLPVDEPDVSVVGVTEGDTLLGQPSKVPVFLSPVDKWRLVKPMLLKYMLPLFCVYTGVAPTLLYPVPSPERYGLISKIIHSIRDYYPLWQLVYQSTVFISRSSISLGLPPLPAKLLPMPAVVQFVILILLVFESAVGFFSDDHEGSSIALVFILISIEGICGGLAYVNVFYRINQERPDPSTVDDLERTKQECEFKIGSLGFSDSSGILLASLLAVPTEIQLCRTQVARGKMFCKGL